MQLTTAPSNDFNAGSMLVRSTPSSLAFLHKVRAYHDGQESDTSDGPHEQESMKRLLHSNPADMARVVFLPQSKLNSFPEEINCYDEHGTPWQEGDLMVHFAGAWAHVQGEDPTGQLMDQYKRFSEWNYDELPNPAVP
jgi:mannan polymerase II complex MNN10 subunit